MAAITVASSRFPLVFVTYPAQVGLADLPPFLAELEAVYQRGRLAVVADIGRIANASAAERQAAARGIDAITTKYAGRVVAEAVVTPSALLRGFVTAYTWMKSDKSYPTRCFATRAEAVVWATSRLTEEGIAP